MNKLKLWSLHQSSRLTTILINVAPSTDGINGAFTRFGHIWLNAFGQSYGFGPYDSRPFDNGRIIYDDDQYYDVAESIRFTMPESLAKMALQRSLDRYNNRDYSCLNSTCIDFVADFLYNCGYEFNRNVGIYPSDFISHLRKLSTQTPNFNYNDWYAPLLVGAHVNYFQLIPLEIFNMSQATRKTPNIAQNKEVYDANPNVYDAYYLNAKEIESGAAPLVRYPKDFNGDVIVKKGDYSMRIVPAGVDNDGNEKPFGDFNNSVQVMFKTGDDAKHYGVPAKHVWIMIIIIAAIVAAATFGIVRNIDIKRQERGQSVSMRGMKKSELAYHIDQDGTVHGYHEAAPRKPDNAMTATERKAENVVPADAAAEETWNG